MIGRKEGPREGREFNQDSYFAEYFADILYQKKGFPFTIEWMDDMMFFFASAATSVGTQQRSMLTTRARARIVNHTSEGQARTKTESQGLNLTG